MKRSVSLFERGAQKYSNFVVNSLMYDSLRVSEHFVVSWWCNCNLEFNIAARCDSDYTGEIWNQSGKSTYMYKIFIISIYLQILTLTKYSRKNGIFNEEIEKLNEVILSRSLNINLLLSISRILFAIFVFFEMHATLTRTCSCIHFQPSFIKWLRLGQSTNTDKRNKL